MTQRISRSTAIFLMIVTAYITYYFHADITEGLVWTDQTIIQPHGQLLSNLILGVAIGFVCFMSGWGFWILYEEWLRKNGLKLGCWMVFWADLLCGVWGLVRFQMFCISLLLWLCAYVVLMVLADMETQKR